MRALILLFLAAAHSPAAAQIVIHEFVDDGTYERLGETVAGVGDVDGDGVGDFAMAAPEADVAFNNAGAVRVHSGATGALLYEFHGPAPDSYLASVAGVGDLSGDGTPDLIVGASNDDAGGSHRGHVWVLSGTDGSVLHELIGAMNEDYFGSALCGLGDVDGDGTPDFAVSSNQYMVSAGLVDVYSGADFSLLYRFMANAQQLTKSPTPGAAGDVNGDGFADILMGVYYQQSGGLVEVRSGFDGALLHAIQGLGQFGRGLDGVGDLDGDGRDDFVVGEPVAGSHGRVTVFSGIDAAPLFVFDGAEAIGPFVRYGQTVAGLGDLDGDGLSEMAIGAVNESTVSTNAGSVQIRSGADGALLFTSYGDTGGGHLGEGLAAIGDIDGDGLADILMGQPDGGFGKVRAVSGACNGAPIHSFCRTAPNSVGPGATIGWTGSSSFSANDLVLTVAGVVPNQPGLFFYSFAEAQVPFGDGFRCAVGSATYRLNPPSSASPSGEASRFLDFDQDHYGLFVGSIPKFQFWYRDAAGPGGSGFNLSDGLSVVVCP